MRFEIKCSGIEDLFIALEVAIVIVFCWLLICSQHIVIVITLYYFVTIVSHWWKFAEIYLCLVKDLENFLI